MNRKQAPAPIDESPDYVEFSELQDTSSEAFECAIGLRERGSRWAEEGGE